jgi:uncharacterized protein YjdB
MYSLRMLRIAAFFMALFLAVFVAGCHGFFQAPVLQSISISPSTVALGSSVQLVATGTYDDGSTNTISSGLTWSSSDSTIASVNQSSGVVQGVAAGTATITVTNGTGGIQGTVSFTVTNGTLTSISVTPNPATLTFSLGQTTEQFTATGTYSGGQTVVITNSVTWSASGSTSVTINTTTGLATATGSGVALITATYGSVSGTATLTVQ